jgi:hypothetical protein
MEGSTLVPFNVGTDKTTVSVATGQNDFLPMYGGIANISNTMRRSHQEGVKDYSRVQSSGCATDKE